MLKISIHTKEKRFMVPVPYAFLKILIGCLTSKRLIQYANKIIEKGGKTIFKVPQIEKRDLKPLLRAISENKGLRVVETKLKDGTEVNITL